MVTYDFAKLRKARKSVRDTVLATDERLKAEYEKFIAENPIAHQTIEQVRKEDYKYLHQEV